MSSISLFLQAVHDAVHDCPMKLAYNEPKIYTGGVDVSKWSKLSRSEQKAALSKHWYIYYSYRNPKTNNLKRQPSIKAGANKFGTKKERLLVLKKLKRCLEIILDLGYNPYENNKELGHYIEEVLLKGNDFRFNDLKRKKTVDPANSRKKIEASEGQNVIEVRTSISKEVETSISEAFDSCMEIKEKIMKPNSYVRYKSRINQFREWLKASNIKETEDISVITRKTVILYLNEVLKRTSPRNRNNSRTDIASLFQVMYDNEQIDDNFVRHINVIKSKPERNKTYKPETVEDIVSYLENHDAILLLFIQFISYGFLRPIEICRLKVGDIDIKNSKMYIRAKNKPVKIKIIPKILKDQIPDLSGLTDDLSLFTPDGVGAKWDIVDDNKRDYFTKRFKLVKDHFGLGKDYGLYSFRHTFITKLYQSLAKSMTSNEAKSTLLGITGHDTMVALEKYLRDIDAELPKDFSKHLK